MNKKNKVLGTILLILLSQHVMAQFDVNDPLILTDGHIMLTWNAPECATNNASGWSGNKFKVSYKKSGTLGWDGITYTNDDHEVYDSSLFENGNVYKFRVDYFGPNNNCKNRYRERKLGTSEIYYHKLPLNGEAVFNDVTNTEGLKKIHNEYSDKCLYPYTWAGGSVDSVRMFQWECYSSDPKAFEISSSTIDGIAVVYLKSATLGYCLTPKGLGYGAEIGVSNCSSPLAAYIKEPSALPGRFFLRNWLTDQCLYTGSSDNGAMLIQTACMVNWTKEMFYFENF